MSSELSEVPNGNAAEGQQALPLSSRIVRYDQFFDPKKRRNAYRRTNVAGETKHLKKLNKKNPVLVVRRVFNRKGEHTTTEVDIKGPKLVDFLRDLYKDTDGLDITRSPPSCNIKLLAHTRDAFQHELDLQRDSREPDVELVHELEVALSFIQDDFGVAFSDASAMLHQGTHPSISFDLLWILFPPGSLLYSRDTLLDQDKILKTLRYDVTYSSSKGWHAVIGAEMITYDGKILGPATVNFEVLQYKGSRKLRDLPVYPLEFYADKDGLRRASLERGRRYVTLFQHSFFEVAEGPAAYEEMDSQYDTKLRPFHVYGRIMVDSSMFRENEEVIYSGLNPRATSHLDLSELQDEHYMLCNPTILGFSFTTKRWGGFALDRLKDIIWTSKPFEALVLDSATKSLVHSMVKQHVNGIEFDDLVKGKGQGLIGLLCGPPGCGKTLTAEAVAEATQRPLYCLSAGELGTSSEDVEGNLTRVLHLAQRWKAVVLLDEADVFLAQRNATDIQRNALVSIFLRKLEYYQGIMILTTNLITQCDIAFESRIHFTIHYPTLSRKSQKQIWSTFISQSSGKGCITDGDIETLCKQTSLNGRQIKNSVAVAQSFAAGNGQRLSLDHIVTVLGVARDWQKAKINMLETEREEVVPAKSQQMGGLLDATNIATAALAFISGVLITSAVFAAHRRT